MTWFKKVSISFLITFFLLFSSVVFKNVALATQKEFEETVTNETFTKEDADKTTVENLIHTFNIMVLGPETLALRQEGETGAVGAIGHLIGYMIGHPPVSSGEYLADLGTNLGLPVKSVYAQGTGWQALRPVLPVWRAFRNVTYIAFVIIFVVIGFMIMFRAKINPQTVISVQSALPKIIITLLLVTFSYAIAGLMVDLIYIAIYLLVGIFNLGNLITSPKEVIDLLLTKNPFDLIYIKGKEALLLQGPANALENLIGGIIGIEWYKNLEEATHLNLLGGLIKLTLGVVIFFKLISLFFKLLLSYLAIVLGVIFAPFNILFNALPGNDAFMTWLKTLLANVIVFPAIAGLFLLAAVLIGPREDYNPFYVSEGVGYYPAMKQEKIWIPPFLVVGESGVDANTFQALIALGIIMLAPDVVGMIKKMFKVEPSGLGGAIVAPLLAGPAALWTTGTQIYGLATQGMQMKSAKEQAEYFQRKREEETLTGPKR